MQTDNGSRPRAENETPEGDRKRQEMLEEIVDEAIMATREGKMRWEEFFRPNAFRSQVHRDRENLLDLEIHHEQDTGRIRTAIRHNGDLVTSFHPARQEELQEMMERLQRSAIREEGKIRWTLNSVRKLRQHGAKGEAATMHSVTRKVRELDQSGQEEIELEARITFTDPRGQTADWKTWEDAIDSFLEHDTLNTLIQDHGRRDSQADLLLTGTTFRFNPGNNGPDAPNLALEWEGIRYAARGNTGGTITALADSENIVSQVRVQMHLPDREQARPVLDRPAPRS